MMRLQTALAALAALLMALSAVLAGGAEARSLHNTAHHAVLAAMDDALAGPERPVWTRAKGERGDGDTPDAATAVPPQGAETVAPVWSGPGAVAGLHPVPTSLPPARGPPTRGT